MDADAMNSCGKWYTGRELFKTHLSSDHGIKDIETINFRLNGCALDSSYEVSFWCGLCCNTLQVKDKNLKTGVLTARADHVEGHLKGQNGPKMNMRGWKRPASGVSELVVTLTGSAGETARFEFPAVVSPFSATVENAERSIKRIADTEAPSARSPKKVCPTALWRCVSIPVSSILLSSPTWLTPHLCIQCGCRVEFSASFTTTCMSPRCQNHKICNDCVQVAEGSLLHEVS